ncbi:inositol monophosphatase [Croceibacterium sp. LX-88]|uniref:Inositol monophosphatase n=1 Tax=Croceibacterium selenioxidans TaxID=2838833 RepID=A0ABS5W4H0_9SPHN|nr:inositol monophosphatase family protein [Croceibacterium selenioxidans]MBT2133977.1 inositol monophosphatase [Croceibacterium selenioxidans]
MHELLRDVTRRAITPYYQKLAADEVTAKAADDVVTVADNLSEEMLAEGLAKIIPGLPIVGEEAAHADASVQDRLSSDCWIVDPLDGTRNFAKGQPPFGILIAMASGGEAHTGWIYDCLTDRFCVAHRGKGAFVNGEKISARPTGESPPVAAISLIFMEGARREAVKEAAAGYRLVDVPYCAAEQYPRLALGVNDVSIFERTLAWDHAAGVLWLNEAGGKVARLDGSPYRVDEWARKGLVGAASPALWDEMATRLANLPPE